MGGVIAFRVEQLLELEGKTYQFSQNREQLEQLCKELNRFREEQRGNQVFDRPYLMDKQYDAIPKDKDIYFQQSMDSKYLYTFLLDKIISTSNNYSQFSASQAKFINCQGLSSSQQKMLEQYVKNEFIQ